MKKLFFIALLGWGSITATAQVSDPAERPTADPAQQADPTRQEMTDPSHQEPIDPSQQQQTVEPAQRPTSQPDRQTKEDIQDGFSELTMEELPGPIKKVIKKDFPKAKIDKAYANEKGQYKLEVDMGDGTSRTMMLDEEGKPMDG